MGRDEMAQLPCLIQKLTLVYTEYPRVVVISVLKPDKPDLPFSGSEVLNYKQLHVHPPQQREREVPLHVPGRFLFW